MRKILSAGSDTKGVGKKSITLKTTHSCEFAQNSGQEKSCTYPELIQKIRDGLAIEENFWAAIHIDTWDGKTLLWSTSLVFDFNVYRGFAVEEEILLSFDNQDYSVKGKYDQEKYNDREFRKVFLATRDALMRHVFTEGISYGGLKPD